MDRFVDDFLAEAGRGNNLSSVALEVVGAFGDLCWGMEHDVSSILSDPAFTLRGSDRWVAFQRVGGEIRYYLGPLPEVSPGVALGGGKFTEPEKGVQTSEIGSVGTPKDAVLLADWYLGGGDLSDHSVKRVPR